MQDPVKRHNLMDEFPEFKDKIHTMKLENNHFKHLLSEYEVVDDKIVHIENEGAPVTDETLSELKKTRLSLRDQLYNTLVQG